MKMIAGAASRACLNRSRTRLAPTPTIISTNSLAPMLKNGTFASPATARASSVLPVPGRPTRRTPLGTEDPASSTHLTLHAAVQPEKPADQQQSGAEAEQEILPPRDALVQ